MSEFIVLAPHFYHPLFGMRRKKQKSGYSFLCLAEIFIFESTTHKGGKLSKERIVLIQELWIKQILRTLINEILKLFRKPDLFHQCLITPEQIFFNHFSIFPVPGSAHAQLEFFPVGGMIFPPPTGIG
jgi:hypothetical protein